MATKEPRPVDDNPEWTAEEVSTARTFSALPESLQSKLRKGRGPQKAPRKERVTIRLSADVVGPFRATGEGWQTRVDAALRAWLKANPQP